MNNEKNTDKNKNTRNLESSTEKPKENLTSPSKDSTVIAALEGKASAPSAESDLTGKVLKKRYKLESLLGHGGMCHVYRAKDLMLEAAGERQPYVAIKILLHEFRNQPDAARILIREAKKTQNLSHPNIIRVYDVNVDQGTYFLVMECLDGQTLDEVIKSHRPHGLPYTKAMSLLKQLLSALKYAHNQGIVHADLKPGNIMLSRAGEIKIFDFGVSRAHKLNVDQYAADKPDETSPVSGFTPTYATPELLAGNEPCIADDVFAFSCIAYELLSSKHPFGRKTASQALKENISPRKPRHISRLRWAHLKKAINPNSAQRLNNITLLERGLQTSPWKPALLTLAITPALLFAAYGAMQLKAQISLAETKLAEQQQRMSSNTELLSMTPTAFLAQIDAIPAEQEPYKQAWLRENQRIVIADIEKQVDALLSERVNGYPDYYAVQDALGKAYQLYPDSYSLALINEDVRQGWASTIDALTQRLNSYLEKEQYQRSKKGDDIYTLFRDLQQLNRDSQYIPSKKAQSLFTRTFDAAMRNFDVVKLANLIEIANLIFNQSDDLKQRISQANDLKSAIDEMAAYKKTRAQGEKMPFPYAAAELFYQNKFASLNKQVENMLKVAALDKLAQDIDQFTAHIPNDFVPLVQLRQTMADKYLRFSDILLKRRRPLDANKTMKKAQQLMSLAQQGQQSEA